MVRFLADENFDGHLLKALRRQFPEVEVQRVQDLGLAGRSDAEVLAHAAKTGLSILSHDVHSLVGFAAQRTRAGQRMPGLFEVRIRRNREELAEAIALVAHASSTEEWEGQVEYLPWD